MATLRLTGLSAAMQRRVSLEVRGFYHLGVGEVAGRYVNRDTPEIDIGFSDYVLSLTPDEWADLRDSVDKLLERNTPRNIGG